MFQPPSEWRAPKPEAWPRFRDAKRICIDFECKDEDIEELGPGCYRDDSFICGIGVGIDGGPMTYLPVRHLGGDNVENPAAAWAWFCENLSEFEGDVLGANLYYDLCWAKAKGAIWPKKRRFIDVQIMDTLINELERTARLDSMCKRWGVPGKDKSKLIEAAKAYGLKKPMQEMWKLPARYIGEYNESDLKAPLALFPLLSAKIEQMDMAQLFDIECRITPIIVDMRHRGIRVAEDKLVEFETWTMVEEKVQIEKIKKMTGRTVRLDSFNTSAEIGPVFEAAGITVPRGPKGGFSIKEKWLEHKAGDLGKIVLRGKQMTNARAKFTRPTMDHITHGRVHPVYNQVRSPKGDTSIEMFDEDDEESKGTRTGRFSAEHINITQVPSRQDWAPRYKECFLPEEGMQWFSCDFSQQEPRLVTHYANVLNLSGAKAISRAYFDDPLLDNHDYMAKQTGIERKKAKPIYLGLIYSMGGAKLCRELGLRTMWCVSWGPYRDRQERYFNEEWEARAFRQDLHEDSVYVFEAAGPEGRAIIEQFHERAPFLKELIAACKRNGKKYGEIITLLGRHLHLPTLPNGSYDWIHKCLNMLIQGSAADQVKKATVDVLEQMPYLFLQAIIHDSLAGSTPSRKQTLEVVNIMRNAIVSQYVPFRVDKTEGPSWGGERDLCYHYECIADAISSKQKYCPAHAPRIAA